MSASPFTEQSHHGSGIRSTRITSRHSRRWAKAGEFVFGATIVLSCFSLVLDENSLIWTGPALRFGVHPSLAMRVVPVVCMMSAFLLFVLATGRAALRRPLSHILPLPVICQLLLGAWVVLGSVYSRLVENNAESFFALGMAIFTAPCAYWCFEMAPDRGRLVRILMISLAIGTAPVLASSMAKVFSTDGAYSEYFPVPFALAGLVWFVVPQTAVRVVVAVSTTLLCLFSLKKTGVIALGAMAMPMVIDACIQRFGATAKALRILVGLALAVLAATAGAFLLLADSFRSGEHQFRQYTYMIAWRQFTDSPLWGQLYTGSLTIHNPYYVEHPVMIHNDLLDVLRQGGVIALVLFLVSTLSSWWMLWRFRRYWSIAPAPLLGGAAALSGIFVILSFNPTLTTPDVATVVWTMIGSTLWHQIAFCQTIEERQTAAWFHR